MAEKIDIYDENFKHIGVNDKKLAHKEGLWHKSFICILFNPDKKTVILQKKVPGRYSFNRPDYFDFTVGGHYQIGETTEQGVREVKEELGLDIPFKEFISLGIRKKAATVAKDFIENEFQFMFILPIKLALTEFPIDGEEVCGLVEIKIDDALRLMKGEIQTTVCNVMDKTLEGNKLSTQEISLKDFVPSYVSDKLYERFFEQIKKYIEDMKLDLWNLNE